MEVLDDDSELDVKTLQELGSRALEGVHSKKELDLIGASSGWVDMSPQSLFLLTVRDVALKLDDTRVLETSGIKYFLRHKNKLLRGRTPLDMCIAGEPELAIEAVRCFADTERGFGAEIDDLQERLDRAEAYLDNN